jgi:hypothetical protein
LLPNGWLGTVYVAAEKVPLAVVVVVPESVTAAPPNVAVIVEFAAKPVPAIESDEPAKPLAGVSVIAGVTVNVADADCPDAVNWTVLPPAGAAGTVNVAPENEPVELVVVVPPTVTDEPPKVALIAAPAGKLEPLTETLSPMWPVIGARVIDGVGIVKDAVSVLPAASVATTAFAPGAWLGTE